MSAMTRRDFVYLSAASSLMVGRTDRALAASGGRRFALDARPAPVTLETAASAVIVVDMQNDFASQGGMLDRAGADISGIQRAVPSMARALAAARAAGIRVVYLKMGYTPDLADLGTPGSVNRTMHEALGVGQSHTAPDGRAGRILVRDTWNTDIIPALQPHPGDLVLYKTRFSGFYRTDLHERLGAAGIRHLIVIGCTTSVCVESTVRDAMFRDYLPVVLSDCTNEVVGADRAYTNHHATLDLIEARLGWVSSAEALVRSLVSG